MGSKVWNVRLRSMRLAGVTSLLLCGAMVAVAEITKEEGVLVLTNDNFQEAVDGNEFILVEFYAPWCGHCKALAPEYAKAAGILAERDSPIKLAKVDATEESATAEKFGVRGYPTLKFFKNGKPMEYTGGRTVDTILSWIAKKTGPPAVSLDTEEAADKFIKANEVVILGFFQSADSESAKEFVQAAESMEDKVFGIITDPTLYDKFEATDNMVVLLKKFDEGKNVLGGKLNKENIVEFVKSNSIPLVFEFNQESSKKIFGSDIKVQFMLFSSAKDEAHKERLELVTKLAKDLKGEMVFAYIPMDEPGSKRIVDHIGVTNAPTFRITTTGQEFIKYKPDTDNITEKNMRAFISSYLSNSLERYLKTEEVPKDWDSKPVKVLVGKNFEEVALDTTKDVLVKFYAPWCGHCKKLVPVYDQLAEHFKSDDDVVIAKLDATVNEISLKEAKVSGFPTLILFHKDGQVSKYEGDRSLESLKEFVRPAAAVEDVDEGDEYDDGDYDDYEEDEGDEEHDDQHAKDEL